MKLCIDCKWFHYHAEERPDPKSEKWNNAFAYCKIPQTDPITGTVSALPFHCSSMRSFFGNCGPEAKLHEASFRKETQQEASKTMFK
jgi:hypothetical protein